MNISLGKRATMKINFLETIFPKSIVD